jgi:hypothetical protein
MLSTDVHLVAASDAGSIQNLPWAAHMVIGLALVTGLVLWLAGRSVLKGCFALLGALGGGCLGFLLLPEATASVGGVPSPYIGLAGGAAAGFVAGVTLFRFAVAISTGAAMCVAAVLIAATALKIEPAPVAVEPPGFLTTLQELGTPSEPRPKDDLPEAAQVVIEGMRPVAERVREFARENSQRARSTWDAQPDRSRTILGLAGLGGAFAGFVIGMYAPKRSTALATAMIGSGIVLGSAAWLLQAFGNPLNVRLDHGPMVWVGAWGLAAAAGLAFQLRPQRKSNPPAAA